MAGQLATSRSGKAYLWFAFLSYLIKLTAVNPMQK
jgi:hypothetical protein